MEHRKLLASSVLCLVALSDPLGAQSRSGKVFARYSKPLRTATLDLATGTLVRGPLVQDRSATTVVDFFNNDLSGFIGVDTGGGFCEWVDAGVKGSLVGDGTDNLNSGLTSDAMNSVVFAYCSSALDVLSGGPGGSVQLGFYSGYSVGGPLPPPVATFELTGLPANTASSSFYSGFRCYLIRITFPELVCFDDGPIGYSWRFLDNGTGTINPHGATLAATWPFLSYVASASGGTGTRDSQGMTDYLDEYCPPGTLLSTFSFGTTSGSFTSLSMAIEEVTPVTPTITSGNHATFPNPDVLTTTPMRVCAPITATITLGLGRTKAGFWYLYPGTSVLNPSVVLPQFYPPPSFPLNFGTNKAGRVLLCALNPTPICMGPTTIAPPGTTFSCTFQLPRLFSIVCSPFCFQALIRANVQPGADGGGNSRLTNRVSGLIGTK